jgi:mono/diheme cytochrome c family protein
MRRLILIGLLAASPALADEGTIELRNAPGREVVEQNCGACHSLDYIEMNSPFMTREVWEAEVTKMVKAFGAPIADTDAATIVQYLATNYGGQATGTSPRGARQGR